MRRNKKRGKMKQPAAATVKPPEKQQGQLPPGLFAAGQSPVPVMDAFANPAARMGTNSNSIMEATEYSMTRITGDMGLMNALYRNNWIVKRLIDVVPEDMMKNGYRLDSQLDVDARRKLARIERQIGLRAKV